MAAVAGLAVLLAGVPSARAAQTQIAIRDFRFDPDSVRVRVGGTVRWMTADDSSTETHNVSGGIFRSGNLSDQIDYSADFSAGTFPYICESHVRQGMDGVVKVPVTINPKPAGRPFTVKWATTATHTGTTYDVQYKIGTGEWRNWLSETDSKSAVFGKGREPIRVRANKTYSFRARSRLVDIKSGWSPKRSFKT